MVDEILRDKLKKRLLMIGGLGLLAMSPINATETLLEKPSELKTIYDEKGRIIEMFKNNKHYKILYDNDKIQEIKDL